MEKTITKGLINLLLHTVIITPIGVMIMFILEKTNNNTFILITMSVICACWLTDTIKELIKEFNKED